MNAPIRHASALQLAFDDPRDVELEANVLGLALLGEPLPEWLEERHLWASQHKFVYRHIRELGAGANLPTVAKLIRERGLLERPYLPDPIDSAGLAQLMWGAKFARDMGWAIEPEELRELADQRDLLEAMRGTAIRMRAGYWTAAEARMHLREVG